LTREFSLLCDRIFTLPSSSECGFTNSSEKPWKKSSGSSRTLLILLNLMKVWWMGDSSEDLEGLVLPDCGELR
jgi:hypothetical protein